MTEFLAAVLAFPTVVFTILLGVVVVYWLFVMLGALDVDLLGGDADAGDLDADGDADGFAGLAQSIGLGGVPVTLSVSLVVLVAWVLCLVGMQALGAGRPGWVAGATALAAFVVAVVAAGFLVRPLRSYFVTHPAIGHRSLVGKICTITTLSVDERYGQAEIEDGGAGLLVQVRCAPENKGRLTRSDRAIILDYKDEVFHVAPLDEAFVKSLRDLG